MADTLGKSSDAPSTSKDKPPGLPPKGQEGGGSAEGQQAESSAPAPLRGTPGRPSDVRARQASGLGTAVAYGLSLATVGRKLFGGR
jgi:hypothetical protein